MGAYFSDEAIPDGLRRVIERSSISLSLASYTQPDCPLVGVNDKFCSMTGYDPDEVLGRNCRFLQPESGAGPVRERMRSFLETDRLSDAKFLIPNVTKDGTPFLNLLYMSRLTRHDRVAYVLGSQFEVKPNARSDTDFYQRSLVEDLRNMRNILGDSALVLLGSFESLASSHSLIAKAGIERLDESD